MKSIIPHPRRFMLASLLRHFAAICDKNLMMPYFSKIFISLSFQVFPSYGCSLRARLKRVFPYKTVCGFAYFFNPRIVSFAPRITVPISQNMPLNRVSPDRHIAPASVFLHYFVHINKLFLFLDLKS